MIEFETKVLDINVDEIRVKLEKLCPEKKEYFYRRWIFDIDSELTKWIRLRTDGKKSSLTYKKKAGLGIGDTEEIEIEIEDFDKAYEIFSKISFKGKNYYETKRIQFKLDDLEFNIDTWPKIPVYLEIEGPSEEKVKEGLKMIGLEGKDDGNMGGIAIFKKYGFDLRSFGELRFE